MLHFPRWQIILILTVVFLGFLAVIPNFLSKETLAGWPSFLPKSQMVLGLDLQGGAYLLYEVDRADYTAKRLTALTSDVRKAMLQDPRIGYTGLGVQGETVQLRVRDLDKLDEVRKRLASLRNPLNASLLSAGSVNEFDLSVADDGLVRFTYSPAGLTQRVRRSCSSRSRSSTGASTSSAPPSRRSSARATTASWSRRRASAIRSA